MTRRKVQMTYMTSDSARRVTYNKRKSSLLKKMNELSTLCDVEVCGIIYSPTEVKPTLYPSPTKVQHVLNRFTTMTELDQEKNMLDMAGFLQQSIMKEEEKLERLKRENGENEMARVMFAALNSPVILEGMGPVELKDLSVAIDRYSMFVHMQSIKIAKIRAAEAAEQA